MSVTPEPAILLAPYTTLQIGGAAEYFLTVSSVSELEEACAWAEERAVPVTILGGGSNVLIADSGIAGLVIRMAMTGRTVVSEEEMSVTVTYGAGEMFDDVVADTVAQGWWGLENLSHIPGTVGATPIQNVGAYGVEVADCIVSVSVFDPHRKTVYAIPAAACGFGYRTSYFKSPEGRRLVVVGVTFRLSRIPHPQLRYADLKVLDQPYPPRQETVRATVIEIRSRKFPDWHRFGTAGSFFKNPIVDMATYERLRSQFPALPSHPVADGQYKLALGWILDVVCGYKGYRSGPVGTYESQALVVVNYGTATASDVHTFAEAVAATVRRKVGIVIEWEVTSLPRKM